MAAVQQHKEQFNFWQALNDLEFVTWSFTWLFRLMSRLAEPMMTLAAIYIIIEAGVPSVSVFWLHWLSVALLISAPEIILPGGFILAGELHVQKNPRWWLLLLMCWLFVVLTAVTLADLFVLHWTGTLFQVLMWARCAAAFGYSILFRVITHRPMSSESPTPSQLLPVPDVTAKIGDMQAAFTQQIQGLSREIRAAKSQSIVTEKRSYCEQVKWSESAFYSSPLSEESSYGFAECSPVSFQKEADFLEEDSPDFGEHFPENMQEEERQATPSQAVTRRKTAMTFEEAAISTGYSISTLKTQLKDGIIKQSLSGKLLVSSLKMKPVNSAKNVQGLPALQLVR